MTSFLGLRRHTAIINASNTLSVAIVGFIDQPKIADLAKITGERDALMLQISQHNEEIKSVRDTCKEQLVQASMEQQIGYFELKLLIYMYNYEAPVALYSRQCITMHN